VDISQGKIRIKEEIPYGKRYGVCHNYVFTKLMGIVGRAPKVLNIRGQRDYYTYARITDDGKEELYGLNITEFFDSIDERSVQPGDIAVYVSDDTEKSLSDRITHTGEVIDNNYIESKWGPIHAIFEHPTTYVPACFGKYIIYMRLNIEKPRLLAAVQEKLNQEPIRKKYAELACENQRELFDNLKKYEESRALIYGQEICKSLEYDMNVHLDVPDENGITPLMHAERIGCEGLQKLFAAYQKYNE
jgi:hypothetical protein